MREHRGLRIPDPADAAIAWPARDERSTGPVATWHPELAAWLVTGEDRAWGSPVELVQHLGNDWGLFRPATEQASLGLATTRELLAEITARIEVDGHVGGGGLDYSTVHGRPARDEAAARLRDSLQVAEQQLAAIRDLADRATERAATSPSRTFYGDPFPAAVPAEQLLAILDGEAPA